MRRYPLKPDTPSEVKLRATGTGLLIHNLATRYISLIAGKTMRPAYIVHTSLKSYICQLTNIEQSKSKDTPTPPPPNKRSHPLPSEIANNEVVCLFAVTTVTKSYIVHI